MNLPDTDGEIVSNISDMYYQDGKMIFSHYEIIGKFPNIKKNIGGVWRILTSNNTITYQP